MTPSPSKPRIWMLFAHHLGDNIQIRAVAEAAAGGEAQDDAEITGFQLEFNAAMKRYPKALLGATLITLREDPGFRPPWPDMVISSGRRPIPAARWIRRASGGNTKFVWIGRPCIPLDQVDLVLTTPQYMLPAAPNVVMFTMPFGVKTASAAPRRAVALLGGSSKAAHVTLEYIDRFADAAAAMAAESGLPLSVSTSPRSPEGSAERLAARLPGAEIYDFRAQKGADNPYRRWLAEAGACLVSGDSVSLLSDALGAGARVTLLPTPTRAMLARYGDTWWGRRWFKDNGNRPWFRPPAHLPAIHERLVALGLAEWDGGLLRIGDVAPAVRAEHAEGIARVRALLHAPR